MNNNIYSLKIKPLTCYKQLKQYNVCTSVLGDLLPIVNNLLGKWNIYKTVTVLS